MEGEQNNNLGASGENKSLAGPIIGAVVILAIVVLGGLYFWGQRANNDELKTDEAVESINLQSEANDTASIEADLDATEIENLDSELNAS